MVQTVLMFAAITAIFEAVLLLRFSSYGWLTSSFGVNVPVRKSTFRWGVRRVEYMKHSSAIHIIAIGGNLAVHWGTIVGTMTAVMAGLVSFVTVPAVLWLLHAKLVRELRTDMEGANGIQIRE